MFRLLFQKIASVRKRASVWPLRKYEQIDHDPVKGSGPACNNVSEPVLGGRHDILGGSLSNASPEKEQERTRFRSN